jgi:hypothetical protein
VVEEDIRYDVFLMSGQWMRVSIRTVRGSVVDFAVQLEVVVGGKTYVVVRYDASHGHAHCDMLDANGKTVRKIWMPEHLTIETALYFAESDLRENFTVYTNRFVEMYLK